MLEPYARAPWSPEDLGALLRAFWAGQAPDWRAPANGEPCLRREATAPRADQPTVYVQTAVRSARVHGLSRHLTAKIGRLTLC